MVISLSSVSQMSPRFSPECTTNLPGGEGWNFFTFSWDATRKTNVLAVREALLKLVGSCRILDSLAGKAGDVFYNHMMGQKPLLDSPAHQSNW